MTTGIEFLKPIKEKKSRGPSKRGVMFNTSIRLPEEVVEYFREQHPYNTQGKIREILWNYVKEQTRENGAT